MRYDRDFVALAGLTLDDVALAPSLRRDGGVETSRPTSSPALDTAGPASFQEVIAEERSILSARRGSPPDGDVVGLALSGGGIRSATLSLGFLQVLTKQGVLSAVDYLSTVSGAGYASGYLYSSASETKPRPAMSRAAELDAGPRDYTHVFEDRDRHEQLIRAGKYLAPGRGIQSIFNVIRVLGTVVFSTLLQFAWLAAFIACLSYGIRWGAAMASQYLPGMSAYPRHAPRWQDLLPGSIVLATWVLGLHLVGVALSDLRPELRGTLRRAIMSAIGAVVACVLTVLLAVQTASIVDGGIAALLGTLRAWDAVLAASSARDPRMAWVLFALLSLIWIVPKAWSAYFEREERKILPYWALGAALAALCVSCAYRVAGGTLSAIAFEPGTGTDFERFATSAFIFVVLGFMTNANALSSHALFSDLIARSFLSIRSRSTTSVGSRVLDNIVMPRRAALRLKDLDTEHLPYPLYNACVNLFDESDPAFPGARCGDYFVLSPRFCGSARTGYGKTTEAPYAGLSLAEAVACSAASVSPLMGSDTNKTLSLVLSVFNLTLNRWMPNPKQSKGFRLHFWPYYQLRASLGKLNTSLDLVNVSDGGFIENLGVFELLRRRCKLIVCLDNTYDPAYEFKHLRNLVMRARNELGLELTFRDAPEDQIRPSAAHGFSKRSFVVADVQTIPGYPEAWAGGILIYAKASVTQPKRWKDRSDMDTSYCYKTYHPHFPQESTSDQFFEEAQWQAHYRLGQEIAARVLAFANLEEAEQNAPPLTREQLIALHQEPVRAADQP